MSTPSVPASLTHLTVPSSALLATLPDGYEGIASGVLAFHPTASPDQVLLVQRAAHDSYPHQWEVPGGAVDDTDASFLDGAARELLEEGGLVVAEWIGPVGLGDGDGEDELERTAGYTWITRRGKKIIKFSVEAEVADPAEVRLDPNEHQDWVWATREDVEANECRGRKLAFTAEGQRKIVLEGFRTRAERKAVAAGQDDDGKVNTVKTAA